MTSKTKATKPRALVIFVQPLGGALYYALYNDVYAHGYKSYRSKKNGSMYLVKIDGRIKNNCFMAIDTLPKRVQDFVKEALFQIKTA